MKTLIVGPNAKVATYHGGGSASLAAYYAVTPFDGISSKLSHPAAYTVGCYAHKELPQLGAILKTDKGEPGVTFRAYNSPPSMKDREICDEIVLTKTDFLLVDYKCSKLTSDLWYADIEGYLTAEETCTFELGLSVHGTANLFVDGKLVIDNETVQRQGTAFFGAATMEEKGTFDVEKGKKYHVKVEFASAPSSKLDKTGHINIPGGAIRIGGAKIIDAEKEIKHAAELAKEADQVIVCAGLNVSLSSYLLVLLQSNLHVLLGRLGN